MFKKTMIGLALSLPVLTGAVMASETDGVSIGLGAGANYGGLVGVTATVPVAEDVELFGGLGYMSAVGYVAGVNYYVTDSVRLIANYGTNSAVEDVNGFKQYQGINIGVGYVGRSRDGWTIDLMYRDLKAARDRIAELESQGYVMAQAGTSVGLSFGYRF